ncbi:AMP-binding protein [Niveibacterium sp.]|uniref:AMP-binding protein n=1 Tax=Niveibacterium sp. TaxID=2017444 RepID=UPI0035B0956F
MSVRPASVRALLERQAAAQPERPFLLSPQSASSLDYAQLAARARGLAWWLEARGIRPGQHVAWLLPNGAQSVRLLLGCMAGGYVATPLSLLAQPTQLGYVIQHSECRVVFVSPSHLPTLQAAIDGIAKAPTVFVVDPEDPAFVDESAEHGWPSPEPTSDRPALLMYTSGTTGRPKGVVLSQRNVLAGARNVSDAHCLSQHDRVLAVLPLYHINAQIVTVLAPLYHGGSLVMPPRFSASQFWAQTIEHNCTWINLVPTMIAYLLAADTSLDPASLRALRFARSASAPLAPELLRAFEARFGIGVIETMGLTETAAPCFSNPFEASLRKTGSPGLPWGCEARVVPPGSADAAPDGIEGEIQIRGANVMAGYYKDPDATAAALTSDGWLRTGDLGRRDADGFYTVTGRLKEIIIKGGENIAPREIDEALLAHPAVLEAAATGIPDKVYGQDIVAGVVLHPGASCDEASLLAHCTRALGAFKTPRTIHILSALPKGPSGKIQRLKLLDEVRA